MPKPTSPTKSSRRGTRSRPGYTLVECMIASALLATSAIGISGTMVSSYAHDTYSKQQYEAVKAGSSLVTELSSLPIDAATSSDVALMDFAAYTDNVTAESGSTVVATMSASKRQPDQNIGDAAVSDPGLLGAVVNTVGGVLGGGTNQQGQNSGTTATSTTTTTTPPPSSTSSTTTAPKTKRAVQIERRSTIAGAALATGELAIVTVDVTAADGRKVRLKRLVSSAEAASNAMK